MKYLLLFILFVSPFLSAQHKPLRFTAKIENRNSDSLTIRFGSSIRLMTCDAEGNFKDIFSYQPGIYRVFDGKEWATVYFKDGFDLNMTLDAKMFDETLSFTGKGAAENNFLAKKFLIIENLEKSLAGYTDYKAAVKKIDSVFDGLGKNLKNSALDKDFKSLESKLIDVDKYGVKSSVERNVKINNIKGRPSPDFEYDNYAGGKTWLKDFSGKYVYIDVWATWCGPCLRELPHLLRLEKQFQGKNIAFVSISVDSELYKWKKFEKENALQGIRLYSYKGTDSSFMKAYGIESIPRFILIDPDGRVIDPDAKRPGNPELWEQLDKLLN